MNRHDRELFNSYGIKPAIYPLVKAISSHPGLSNEGYAELCKVTGQWVARLADKLAKLGIIKDASLHQGRRAWVISEPRVPKLIRLAEEARKGGVR